MPGPQHRYDLLKKRLDLFTRMLPGVAEGDVRALHRTRIASRRLRELLPILQIENNLARKLNRRLRRVTERLGAVRELDVLMLLLDELHESGRFSQGGLSRMASTVAHDRDEARERLGSRMPPEELKRVANKLDDVAGELKSGRASKRRVEAASRWAVDARIARRADRLKDAMREAGAVYLPERLHNVRIALKKLRYALELAAEIAGEKRNADLRELKRAQDLLGRMHDLEGLIDRIRQIQAAAPADAKAERELEVIVETLENDCRRLHARYVRARAALAAIYGRAAARTRAASGRLGFARRATGRATLTG